VAPHRLWPRRAATGIDADFNPKLVRGPAREPVHRGDIIQAPLDTDGVVFQQRVEYHCGDVGVLQRDFVVLLAFSNSMNGVNFTSLR
jgi:hypothetical protein